MATATISKSQRIRDYLAANPTSANPDIVAALSGYGVTYGDLMSVKTQLKKQGGKKTRSARKGSAALSKKTTVSAAGRKAAPKASSLTSGGVPAIQAGMRFVDEAGSVDEAIEILTLIRTVQQA